QSRAQKQTIQQLKHDVGYLASDELEGRATGSAGEKKAGDYIIERYRQKKITPYQSDYRYPFTFIKGKEIGNNTQIRVGNKSLRVPEEAFPLPYSANRKISQTVLPDIKEQGNIWLVPLYQNETEANDPHFDWEKYAFEQSREAARLGAKGIVFYDAYQSKYPAAFNSKNENEQLDIPAAVILSNAWQNSDVNS